MAGDYRSHTADEEWAWKHLSKLTCCITFLSLTQPQDFLIIIWKIERTITCTV